MPHACRCWGCSIPYFSFPENKPLPAPGSSTEKREACLPPDHEVFRTPNHGGDGVAAEFPLPAWEMTPHWELSLAAGCSLGSTGLVPPPGVEREAAAQQCKAGPGREPPSSFVLARTVGPLEGWWSDV